MPGSGDRDRSTLGPVALAPPSSVRPPQSSDAARSRLTDAAILVAAASVPLLGRLMSFDGSGLVWLPGLDRLPLPVLCPSRWFGFRCLTCGVTRSIIALMHGDWAASLALHRFGWLILVLIVAQIPYRAIRLLRPDRRLPVIERLGIASLIATAVLIATGRILEAIGR